MCGMKMFKGKYYYAPQNIMILSVAKNKLEHFVKELNSPVTMQAKAHQEDPMSRNLLLITPLDLIFSLLHLF
jgi:hypothetical protein